MTLSLVRSPGRTALGLALGAVLAAGCGSDLVEAEPSPRLELQGIVRRADDGRPIPGAMVGLRATEPGNGLAVVAETTTDAQGRYALSYAAAPGECPGLMAAATLESWHTARYTAVPSRPVRCTSAEQRIDVRLVFEPF